MKETPMVDENARCPYCGRWFKEGGPILWHMLAKHGPNKDKYHAIFSANGKKGKEAQ